MIDERIAEIRRRKGDSIPLAEVGAIVRSLVSGLTGDAAACDARLYHEIENLARYIHAAKAEIAALNPADIREEFLPTAADELDAIVQSTETATGAIMDATEVIEAHLDGLPADTAEAIRQAATRIYEACSFQDITGQRITKVVRMLKNIEERVDSLVDAFDPERHGVVLDIGGTAGRGGGRSSSQRSSRVSAQGDRPTDADLLNGPAAEGEGIGQDDVDALLSKFE